MYLETHPMRRRNPRNLTLLWKTKASETELPRNAAPPRGSGTVPTTGKKRRKVSIKNKLERKRKRLRKKRSTSEFELIYYAK